MATVAEFIKFLETLPQEAIIELPYCELGRSYEGYDPRFVEFEIPTGDLYLEKMVSVFDFRENPFINPDEDNYNKVYIELGYIG